VAFVVYAVSVPGSMPTWPVLCRLCVSEGSNFNLFVLSQLTANLSKRSPVRRQCTCEACRMVLVELHHYTCSQRKEALPLVYVTPPSQPFTRACW